MNSTLMNSSCPDKDAEIHIFMIVFVMVGSILGNSIICLLLVRFKTLRTVPNILVVNLAVVDILNAVINMPLMILWYICQVPYLKGPKISWFVVTLYVLFMYLTVFSLTMLAVDRFGAIVLSFRYHTWKTVNKAKVAVVFVWFSAAAYTYGMFTMGLNIDLGDAPVLEYRIHYLKKFGRHFLLPGYLVPFIVILILGGTIWYTVRSHNKHIKPSRSSVKQVKSDVKTAKTIGLTCAAFFLMGVFPMLLHRISRIHGTWPHFLAFFLMHLNSMVNPIIYALTTKRFRKAFVLFMKEPCGKSQPRMMSSTNRRDVHYKTSIVTPPSSSSTSVRQATTSVVLKHGA